MLYCLIGKIVMLGVLPLAGYIGLLCGVGVLAEKLQMVLLDSLQQADFWTAEVTSWPLRWLDEIQAEWVAQAALVGWLIVVSPFIIAFGYPELGIRLMIWRCKTPKNGPAATPA